MPNDFGVYPNWCLMILLCIQVDYAAPIWILPAQPDRCNRFMGNQISLNADPQEKGRGCIGYIYNHDIPTIATAWRDHYTDQIDDSARVFIYRIPTNNPKGKGKGTGKSKPKGKGTGKPKPKGKGTGKPKPKGKGTGKPK
eukprot:48390_1